MIPRYDFDSNRFQTSVRLPRPENAKKRWPRHFAAYASSNDWGLVITGGNAMRLADYVLYSYL